MTVGLEPSIANAVWNYLLRVGSAPTQPAAVWAKLHLGDPGAAGTANPAANTQRQQITFGAASGGIALNSGTVTWPTVSTTENITHVSFWTASTAGTFICSGTISNGNVIAGQDLIASIGAISAQLNVAG